MNRIESRSSRVRKCKCTSDHDAEIINGMLYYGDDSFVGYTACLVEHDESRHVWIGFITGQWEGVDSEDCCVLVHLYIVGDNIQMDIGRGDLDPFDPDEIFDSYILARDQVLAQPVQRNGLLVIIKSYLKQINMYGIT
ncbi:hypothetical protein [Shewanella sp. OMA3-2]|uniref:hypothetical protein n=1 Tax=Shewanella sp. OMA3-2 TaxID=2908650 RepID=UPI001F3E0950|nr:hypothetical protein [Shewanella sp. OMA3-2]UJF20747.1 hypothetical protein L0B17_11210 [Shewanella sp. OMA3-2]